jgi:hypothetical protein
MNLLNGLAQENSVQEYSGKLWAEAHARAVSWVRLGFPDNILDDEKIPTELRDRVWRFVQASDAEPSESLPPKAPGNWFEDPEVGSNWVSYVAKLVSRKWPDKAIQSIEESTRRIMNFLFDPSIPGIHQKYGLVVGKVQSGKTANYAGLIARAVDAGFDVIVVLAGLHNNLRRQTQKRLEDEIAKLDPENPTSRRLIALTDDERDFKPLPTHELFNTGPESAVLVVVKKNVSPLTHLVEQLGKLSEIERMGLNILVVDDEADHATINTKKLDGEARSANPDFESYEDSEEEETDYEITDTTKINSSIRQILGLFSRYAYVGYTATPFANVLIDPDEDHSSLGPTLYPRDFILALPKPEGYSGLEDFFPTENLAMENSNRVMVVPNSDALTLREMEAANEIGRSSDLPDSLMHALMDYYLSGAVRLRRKGRGFHHTMLVHVKHTKANQSPVHGRINQLMEIWREHIPNDYSNEGSDLRAKMKERWLNEFESQNGTVETWSEIESSLIDFVNLGIQVLLINSDTGEDLDYEVNEKDGLRVIAVGGNRLSRGLTLEGLCCTYFVRESKMYDTLTQMGRWFGFREGYRDLVRLYTTGLLVEWFTWLTAVERELLSDIQRYRDTPYTPTCLAVRILRHRAMLPTARNKMRHARAVTNGLSASTPRMTRFLFDDSDALKSNLENASDFLQGLGEPNGKPLGSKNSLLWKGVDPYVVLSLVQGHRHHPEDRTFDNQIVENYVKSRLEKDELSEWSIGLISTEDGKADKPFADFGFDIDLQLPMRTRINGRDSVGELIQASNVVIDLPGQLNDYLINGQVSYPRMYETRDPANPLLLIYVLDKDSQPANKTKNSASRVSLFKYDQERVHVVGLAMALPVTASEAEDAEKDTKEFWTLKGMDYDG